ncbi:hypothetical protein VTN00DRAFT_2158 [Thermoascus crustaceus]|uniref:uncharacterized protein n=1 Tax=Thermoascus crustaceus TaxID=5088 RepID=UPI003742989C
MSLGTVVPPGNDHKRETRRGWERVRTVDDRAEGRAEWSQRDALRVDDAWYREDVFSQDPAPGGSRRTSVRRARAERIARTICGGEQSPVSQKRFGPKAANQRGRPLAASTAALNLAALSGVWEAGMSTGGKSTQIAQPTRGRREPPGDLFPVPDEPWTGLARDMKCVGCGRLLRTASKAE